MRINLRLISVVIYLLISSSIVAQNIRISGSVYDYQGKPIFAANIYLKNNLDKGCTSDLDGFFSFDIMLDNMKDTLAVSFIGYEKKVIPLAVIDVNKPIYIRLKEDQNTLTEIVVKTNPSLSKEFSIQNVSKLDIYSTPTASGDVLKMITTLPASTNTTESANPELRGSSSDMSRVVLNDVPIYNPVRNSQISGMGNFSLLNTELVSNLNIYASNPPLIYGNSTAGLVEVETIKQLKSNQTQLTTSLANIGLLHSQQLKKKSFIQLYGNYQFSNPYISINKNNIDNLESFSSKDIGLNFHVEAVKGLTLNLYSYFIDEKYLSGEYLYTYYGDMSAKKKRNFNVLNVKIRTDKTVFSYSSGTNFSVTEYKFGNINSRQNDKQLYNCMDVKHFINESFYIQAGLTSDFNTINFSNQFSYFYYAVSPNDSFYVFDNKINNHSLESFFYGRLRLSSKIILGGGVRKNIPIKGQRSYISFQTSLRCAIDTKNSILLSGGKYNGYSVPIYFMQDFTPIASNQLAFEYRFNKDGLQFGGSTYLKDENYSQYYTDIGKIQNTRKTIKGVELFGEKSVNNLNFSVSYTYLHSEINRDGKWYRAPNMMSYLMKISTTYSNIKYGIVGLSFFTRPGHYYTPVISSLKNSNVAAYEPITGVYNSSQYNSYLSLDFTYSKLIKYKDSNVICFINIRNILNNKNKMENIYNSDYSSIIDYQYYQKRLVYCGLQLNF